MCQLKPLFDHASVCQLKTLVDVQGPQEHESNTLPMNGTETWTGGRLSNRGQQPPRGRREAAQNDPSTRTLADDVL